MKRKMPPNPAQFFTPIRHHMRPFAIEVRVYGVTNRKDSTVQRQIIRAARGLAKATGGKVVAYSDDFFMGHKDFKL